MKSAFRVSVNLRRHVYCVGLREGDYSDYEFLWGRYTASENTADMVVMLRALACSRDQTAVAEYVEVSIKLSCVSRFMLFLP